MRLNASTGFEECSRTLRNGLGSLGPAGSVLAQDAKKDAPKKTTAKPPMGFFVTSVGIGNGAVVRLHAGQVTVEHGPVFYYHGGETHELKEGPAPEFTALVTG